MTTMPPAIKVEGRVIVDSQGLCEPRDWHGATEMHLIPWLKPFTSVLFSKAPIAISAPTLVALPLAEDLTQVDFILVLVDVGPLNLMIGGKIPVFTGVGGIFPTGFTGGETFSFEILRNDSSGTITDRLSVATVFTSGAQTAVQVAQQINAAAMLAGAGYLPATVNLGGQLVLSGSAPGANEFVQIAGANSVLGFPTSAAFKSGTGDLIPNNGNFMLEPGLPGNEFWVQGTGTARILVGML